MADDILIKLMGGPRDGEVVRMVKPYQQHLEIKSALRKDLYHQYSFDKSLKNLNEPFIYRFTTRAGKPTTSVVG